MSASTVGLYCAILNWGAWQRGNPSRPHPPTRLVPCAGWRSATVSRPLAAIVPMIIGEDQQAALHAFQVGSSLFIGGCDRPDVEPMASTQSPVTARVRR
jgi:hypothetical protein